MFDLVSFIAAEKLLISQVVTATGRRKLLLSAQVKGQKKKGILTHATLRNMQVPNGTVKKRCRNGNGNATAFG